MQRRRPWRLQRRPCVLTKSTRVNSPLPSPSACATRRTSNSWPHNRAWFVGGSRPTPIICVLRSRGQSVSRSAMNSLYPSAGVTTDSSTRLATRRHGGRTCRSIHWRSQKVFGSEAAPPRRRVTPFPAQSNKALLFRGSISTSSRPVERLAAMQEGE